MIICKSFLIGQTYLPNHKVAPRDYFSWRSPVLESQPLFRKVWFLGTFLWRFHDFWMNWTAWHFERLSLRTQMMMRAAGYSVEVEENYFANVVEEKYSGFVVGTNLIWVDAWQYVSSTLWPPLPSCLTMFAELILSSFSFKWQVCRESWCRIHQLVLLVDPGWKVVL